MALWHIWIDRGGTFTDAIGRDPTTGHLRAIKLLSSDAAPLQAIRQLLGLAEDDPVPACCVRMGTTVATNALLERRGSDCGLVITEGFGDLLAIGDQTRPDLFALAIAPRKPLVQQVFEVSARHDARGHVLLQPEPAALRDALQQLYAAGRRSLAVAVIHAHRDGSLERTIGAAAQDAGFHYVSLSHEVAGAEGLLARAETAVVDAYLTPLLREHLAALAAALPGSQVQMMQSNGDLMPASRFRGRDAVLSGPAGGVVACAEISKALGLGQVVGFDMGGTSTDVCRYAGAYERQQTAEIAGVHLRTPMLAIHTVAAGGGSICRVTEGRLTVGPDSAGADPGPLCYGRPEATALTLTDVNLALGYLDAVRFPFPLQRAPVQAALDALATELATKLGASGQVRSAFEVAEGLRQVADEHMAAAIREVSLRRGHDVRDHAMIVFGGAGGQHACAVARRLGIRTLVFHPLAGVLSAWGIGLAQLGWHGEVAVGPVALVDANVANLATPLIDLASRGRAELAAAGADGEFATEWAVDVRYVGTHLPQTLVLSADLGPTEGLATALATAFARQHAQVFGYTRDDLPLEIVGVRVALRGCETTLATSPLATTQAEATEPATTARLWLDGAWQRVPVWSRGALQPGHTLRGPAIVYDDTATIVVAPGFVGEVGALGCLIVRDCGEARAQHSATPDPRDPVLREVVGARISAVAQQMGVVLQRTAVSTNIRERLDFSCAVFDAAGDLVVNAPYIPVHLGAMPEAIRGVLAVHPQPPPGAVYVTNDPAAGGSHLPDITVISPVHDAEGVLRFFVASRGHHADIGGTTPGSMPPQAQSLAEEGIVLQALPIVQDGKFDRAGLRERLLAGRWPARRPDDNIADIEAQIAANQSGVGLLNELTTEFGPALVTAVMQAIQDDAEMAISAAVRRLPPGPHRFVDALDHGAAIAVEISVHNDRLRVDFTGTAGEDPGNLNAPRAVTVSALLYTLRLLAGRDMPLNSGCLRMVDVIVPPGLLAPGPTRAVAAGNVETAQRIVDVLLGALGLAAASQGTMNNLTFGDTTFAYYETIGGGSGACQGSDGCSGVHTHMTNTRISDPEVLEARFPVRLWRFGLRRGSGGRGQWTGGDGLIRELEFLQAMQVALITERRTRAPFGLEGGAPGALGRNLLDDRALPGRVSLQVAAGQRLRLETPGGGGFGPMSR